MTSKPESRLRARIAARLRALPALVLVQHGSAYSGPGRSDLIGCDRSRFFAIEVKMPGGKTTPAQDAFLEQVRQHGGISGVARSPQEALEILMAKIPDVDNDLAELFASLDLLESDSSHPQGSGVVGYDPSKIVDAPFTVLTPDEAPTAEALAEVKRLHETLSQTQTVHVPPDGAVSPVFESLEPPLVGATIEHLVTDFTPDMILLDQEGYVAGMRELHQKVDAMKAQLDEAIKALLVIAGQTEKKPRARRATSAE